MYPVSHEATWGLGSPAEKQYEFGAYATSMPGSTKFIRLSSRLVWRLLPILLVLLVQWYPSFFKPRTKLVTCKDVLLGTVPTLDQDLR